MPLSQDNLGVLTNSENTCLTPTESLFHYSMASYDLGTLRTTHFLAYLTINVNSKSSSGGNPAVNGREKVCHISLILYMVISERRDLTL